MTNIWVGQKVRLRAVEPEDWEGFRALEQDTVDLRNADIVTPPRSAEGFRSWTAERAGREPGGEAFRLVVEALSDGSFVGSVTVGGVDTRAGHFKSGIEITRDRRGKGYAKEAVALLLTYMFAERRFHKCEVEIHAFNDASLALHRSLGFVEEGRLRQHEYFAGAYQDLVLMGLTADEHWTAHPRPSVR
ncbi:GNAT family protein [Streptomyces sp. NPDC047981]|uniref:GNAT family N-acetyltransferase n=1 Tax=Streptomyces sp. NPDC047981 TaxID=3154610 RepID=UPI003418F8C7